MPGEYFPLFIDLSGKRILVVGAGKIAIRRVRTLCSFTPVSYTHLDVYKRQFFLSAMISV